MAQRIILVRHGRSAHIHKGLLSLADFRRWREAYEAAGLIADEMCPPDLRQLEGFIVSSDAPRAVQSAKLLAEDQEVLVSPLLRELDLLPPELPFVRLPLLAWALFIGMRSKITPAETERVKAAVEWLVGLTQIHGTVIAVTHASVRAAITKQLLKVGWRSETPRPGSRHWSMWEFSL